MVGHPVVIFLWVFSAMLAMSYWEASVEGRHAGHRGKHGFKFHLFGMFVTEYHFFLFMIMLPFLFTLPFIVFGWDLRMFGIVLSAFLLGCVWEDFMWFVVNPDVTLKDWNPRFVNYYKWFKVGKYHFPVFYVIMFLLSFLSWFFLWR